MDSNIVHIWIRYGSVVMIEVILIGVLLVSVYRCLKLWRNWFSPPLKEQKWLVNGKIHREDGPAIVSFNGVQEWWLNDKFYGNKKPWHWKKLVKLARVEMIMTN